ncbi:MAG: polysaccharide biosynthesis tyrosine autokinase [Bacteroidales bacterium]|jgi:capsular exopolysaccharide synthesis family protein|nr:polysaccharide biosynthesis tyrosine autokinase [Bacteroidales bacterium]
MEKQHTSFEEESVDIKAYILKLLGYWYIYPITLGISFILAFFIIKTTHPVYRVTTSILIKDEQSLMDPETVLQNAVSPFSSADYKLQNEIQILKSYDLTKRTIQQLDFSVSYFKEEKFLDRELYKSSPFTIKFDRGHPQPAGLKIFIQKGEDNRFKIWADGEDIPLYLFSDDRIKYTVPGIEFSEHIAPDESLKRNWCSFTVEQNGPMETGKVYFFIFRTPESLVNEFQHFEIENVKYSSVLKIIFDGTNIQKSKDFLNKLNQVYLNRGVEKKNRIALNTIDFIDSQISDISDSLRIAEKNLENYRSSQKIMNIDFQSQQAYQQLERLQNQKAELILKQKYYSYLQNYLTEDRDLQDLISPSSMGIDDQLLNNLILELTRLYAEKVDVMVNSKRENPYLESVKLKIENQKNTLLENIENSLDRAKISLNDINDRIDKLTAEVQTLPQTERKLFSYQREFQLHDALYTFLLQKRSEMQIAKASNFPEHEVIDYPRAGKNNLIAPNKKMIYLISFFLGLGIPVSIILLFDYFNDKISELNDVQKITDHNVMGNIIRNTENTSMVLQDVPNSNIAESFRSLRTNILYTLKGKQSPVMMVTSSMMGEGKSFVSLNLATGFALYHAKVLLLSFDLRKPTISTLLNLHQEKGLSTYLSQHCRLEDIIFQTEIKNLWTIPSGPIPPNPSELIASEKTNQLFDELRKKFDYIIIDTPPIGIVADALMLENYSDINLFIIRHNYTKKRILSNLLNNLNTKKIKDISLVVNDINLKTRNYEYSYGYGYGYY